MSEINCNTFILNNCLNADSAVSKDRNILAVDGFNCQIHTFDCCGSARGCESVLRPYRKLRYDTQSDSYTALCGCNQNIYCIDNNFNENGSVLLETNGNTCNCQCNSNGFCSTNTSCALTDAGITRIGNQPFIVGVFTNGAYLYDTNGKRLTQLCRTERGEELTDFIAFGEEKYAMSTIKNGNRIITISENGRTQSGILKCNLSLRMLFSENQTVYGLFGKSYIYNRILPIYSCGILNLPENTDNCFCSCLS